MKPGTGQSVVRRVLIAAVVAPLAYAATFAITRGAALLSISIHRSWFMQPILLLCSVGLPAATGWTMARRCAPAPLWLGILPVALLWAGETVAHNFAPCPACHSLENFSGIGGVIFSLPAAAIG